MRYLKFSLFILIVVLFLTSCAPKVVKAPPVYLSNVDLIASSIRKLKIPMEQFTANEKVAVLNLEFGEPMDFPVNYLIEDHLLRKLFENNIKIMERDRDVLPSLISEAGIKFRHLPKEVFDTIDYLSSNLRSATKVLAYRVLECGMTYDLIGIEEKKAKSLIEVKVEVSGKPIKKHTKAQVKRTAYTSISARIIDTKTSEITWSGTLTSEVVDTVPMETFVTLGDKNLQFYSHGLPNRDLMKIKAKPTTTVPVAITAPTLMYQPYPYLPTPSMRAPSVKPSLALRFPKLEFTKFRGANHLQIGPAFGRGDGFFISWMKTGGSFISFAPALEFNYQDWQKTGVISLNICFDSEGILANIMPIKLYEYLSIGAAYYPMHGRRYYYYYDPYWGWGSGWSSTWRFEDFGIPITWGIKYYVNPKLSVNLGMKHHIILTRDWASFSDLSLGIGLH